MGPVPKWESLQVFSMYILAVPILILFLLLVTVLLVIWGHWKIALVVLILTIWLNKTTQTYPVDLFYEEEWQAEPQDSTTFSFLTYNVAGEHPDPMKIFLDSIYPDMMILQESGHWERGFKIVKHYPYYEGDVILSKYPVENLHRIQMKEDDPRWETVVDSVYNPKNQFQLYPTVYGMDVLHPSGKIHVIACHLRSNQYTVARRNMEPEQEWSDGLDEYLRRTEFGYRCRAIQADLIRQELDSIGDVPTIVAGDFNDISGSYALKTIQGTQLKDAWWEGGSGFGVTYHAYNIFLRLDHVLYSRHFNLHHIQVLDQAKWSDHYPLTFAVD